MAPGRKLAGPIAVGIYLCVLAGLSLSPDDEAASAAEPEAVSGTNGTRDGRGQIPPNEFKVPRPHMQRALELLERRRSGQPLTGEEKAFLQQVRDRFRKDRTSPAAGVGSRDATPPKPVGDQPADRPTRDVNSLGPGDHYYVAAVGKDTNPGTRDAPWATIAHALTRLRPGDTLNLRAGTYYEHGLTTDIQGTPDRPITIQAFPGEQTVIDGGVPYYQGLNHEEWVLCNPAVDVYRSVRTFSGDYARAWLTEAGMQIYRYKNQADMESTNYGPVNGHTPMFFGPGVQLRSDGHIYVRLSPNPNDQYDVDHRPILAVPSDPNPNHHRMAISVTRSIGDNFIFNSVLQHVIFRHLTVAHAKTLFDLKSGSGHVSFRNCTFSYGTYGLNFRSQVTDVEIANNTFDNQVPYFLYWTDVKNASHEAAEGYPDFQSTAVVGFSSNTRIDGNIFRNGFDGIQAGAGTGVSVRNNQFLELHDDAMNFLTGTSGEVAHNLMWHVNSGIALLGSGTSPGDLFIHHNIIDNTALRRGGRAGNYRAEVWPVWNTDTPFAKHGGGGRTAGWKLYNNTIISRKVAYRTPMNPFPLTANPRYCAVNNIFFAIDDRLIYRDHLAASGATYEGNIVWQSSSGGPIFMGFGDGGAYSSLAEFQANKTGWESRGQQIDPGFDLAAINSPEYRYPDVLQRYRPRNPAVRRLGFSYQGVAWPETAGVDYAGALPVRGGKD